MKRRRRWPWLLLLVVIAVCAAAFLYIYQLLYTPLLPSGEGEDVEFEIARGEKLDSIAARLHKAGLLRDPAALKLAAFFGGGASGIKAGVHHLRSDMSAWQIFEAIQISPAEKYTVLVLPEGFDIFEIAARVEEAGIASAAEFIAAAQNPGVLQELAPGAQTLEGYLFPDTYHVPESAGVDGLIAMMLRRFRDELETGIESRLAAAGLSLGEGVVLASLIAREAGNPEEMPLISSVFHNRLRIGMKLDCDPTFIYARKLAGDWDGVVMGEDRQIDSPYNTYKVRGLPPGPIGNPGRAALLAAAEPAESDYLYFVARGPDTGEGHYFSRNIREHNEAVQKYQQALRAARQGNR